MRVQIPMHVSLVLRSHLNGVYISATNRLSRLLRPRLLQLRTVRFASSRVNGIYNVPVGSNGHVSLSVVHPKLAPSHPGNVIVHLPSGPLFQSARPDGADVSLPSPSHGHNGNGDVTTSFGVDVTTSARALADMTSSTVVNINYRLGELAVPGDWPRPHSENSDTEPKNVTYRYPTPVHDTLMGFDWILETLQPSRLGVVGTHIGGSLALMLALTEPRYIHAVAALEPVCDWTSLDEFCTSSGAALDTSTHHRRKPHHAPPDLVPLLEARERFFPTPGRYFDSFASPILFLRSAGKDVPKAWPRYLTGPEYPIPLLTKESEESLDGEVELWDAYLPEDSDSGYESLETSSTGDEKEQPPVRRRKTLARWPPYGLDYGTSGPRQAWSREPVKKLEITLPWVRIFTNESLYSDSGTSPAEDSIDPHQTGGTTAQKSPSRRRRNQNATVLTRQANEMVDVMRRACFWGRESGFANERVSLVSLESLVRGELERTDELPSHAGEWLVEALNAEADADHTN
ncbi:hypothetical protein BJX65DRAFT_269117, partial [Aspergillus insuetus]